MDSFWCVLGGWAFGLAVLGVGVRVWHNRYGT